MKIRDALGIAIAGIVPTTTIAIFFIFVSFATNADLTLPFIIAALLMIPLTLVYSQLVAAFPRSGGDFIYLSRIFHPAVGAAVGVGLVIFFFLNLGSMAALLGSFVVPEFFRATGAALHSSGLVHFSHTLTGRPGELLVGGLIVLLGFAIGIRGAASLGRATFLCFLAGLLGIALFVAEALSHSHAAFVAAYNHANGANAYQHVIAAARSAHVSLGSTFSGFTSLLPFAAITFWGFTVANYPAGELRRPSKTYLRGTFAGLLAGAALEVVGWLATRKLVGLTFIQASSALNSSNGDLFGRLTHSAPIVTNYYADLVSGDPVTTILLSGAFVIAGLAFLFAMIMGITRLLFALGFDRVIPTAVADVGAKSHAPVKALIVTLLGGWLFVYLTVYQTGFVHSTRNIVLIWAFLFTVGSLSILALVLRRRTIYAASPKIIKGKWFGLEPILVIGTLSAVIQCTLGVIAATNPSLSGGYDTVSVVTLIAIMASGLVVYGVAWSYWRAKGVDLGVSMRDLPPE